MKYITLKSSELELVLDPHHGADILSIKTVPTGEEVLYATPWSDRAEAVHVVFVSLRLRAQRHSGEGQREVPRRQPW